MTTKKYFKLIAVISNSILAVLLANTSVFAIELEISDNGASSSSQVVSTQDTNTSVSQTNNSNIQNDIVVNVDSGSNSANQNSGDVNIQTGQANAQKSIVNENIGNSSVSSGCCDDQNIGIEINGNGANSENSAELNISDKTDISINQKTDINNKSEIKVNSGKNTADQNSGNVSVKTGAVEVASQTKNKNINNYEASVARGGTGISIKIKNNAAGSKNSASFNLDSDTNIGVSSVAKIYNDEQIDANSGKNNANQNEGNVEIKTGEVKVTILTENEDINQGGVEVDCCDPKKEPDDPGDDDNDDPSPPITPPGNGGNGGSGSSAGGNGNGGSSSSDSGSGQVLGISAGGAVLAATGSNFFLYMTIANILTFLFGVYLRLRGGRSPDYEIEFAINR